MRRAWTCCLPPVPLSTHPCPHLLQVRMDALLARQFDLISCLGRVDKLGRHASVNSATAELLDGVRLQVSVVMQVLVG